MKDEVCTDDAPIIWIASRVVLSKHPQINGTYDYLIAFACGFGWILDC
jgi:hypothetical protein